MTQRSRFWMALAAGAASLGSVAMADDIIAPANQRFANKDVSEVPNFQQHVVPLLSRLGCNGRACHGSFQGQGGFRLSLFGYDFKLDHEGLVKGDKDKDREPRVLVEEPEESLALLKATQEMPHRGGKRMDVDSWQYNIFRNWIKDGAKTLSEEAPKFVKLEVTPKEIQFGKSSEQTQLKVIAIWSDGSQEDVTPLCRFNSNDDLIAAIDANGLVKSGEVGDTHVVVNYDQGVVPIPVIRPVTDKTGDKYPKVDTPTKIDELVVQKLRKLGIVPSEVCDDHEFLRRASLDLTGTLPAPQEVVDFLSNPDSDKRAKKIDELLERPGYSAWLSTKLCDYTGNNAANLQNVGGNLSGDLVGEWYDWIYQRVVKNEPYDKLVEGIVVAKSTQPGESYTDYCQRMSAMYGPEKKGSYAEAGGLTYYWGRRNFVNLEDRAIGFAYTFMGIRIQCAQCHKHPFDQWTQDDFHQFKNFFAGVRFAPRPGKEATEERAELMKKLEIDPKKGNGNDLRNALRDRVKKGAVVPVDELVVAKPQAPKEDPKRKKDAKETDKKNARAPAGSTAKLLGAEVVTLYEHDDPRQPLMDWLRGPSNRYFARAFVNRIWASLFSVGIVNPPDDMSLANAPSNAALLDHLTEQFIAHNFDMKWLHREIVNSQTYQRSWKPNETNKLDQKNFSHAIPRRLPAEVALDALRQATLSDTEIARMQTDLKGRAIAIPGTNGRGGNSNGSMSFALTVFGRSTRESNCDCDRSMEASLLQTVYMQNDDQVLGMLNESKGWVNSLVQAGKPARNEKNEKDIASAKSTRRNFEKALEVNERELKKARKAGKEDEVKELEGRLSELKAKIKKVQAVVDGKSTEAPKPAVVVNLEPEDLVKAAYLRSLSRLPSDAEMETSKKFLAQSEDRATGARDLLWALINTKEFIVNH